MLEPLSERSISSKTHDYIVCSFYTPNYADVVGRLSHSLDRHAVLHRLYAVDRIGEAWQLQTLRKPEIVLRAMGDYPGKTVILMDADCTVNGPLDPLLSDADIGLYILQKAARRVVTSSRVAAFRPTPSARNVLDLWHQKCRAAIDSVQHVRVKRRHLLSRKLTETDEGLLMEALFSTPGVTIKLFPGEFIGRNDGMSNRIPLISHESARGMQRNASLIRRLIRMI